MMSVAPPASFPSQPPETVLDIQSHNWDKGTVSHSPLPGPEEPGKPSKRLVYRSSEIEVPYSATLLVCHNGLIKGKEYKQARHKTPEGYEAAEMKAPKPARAKKPGADPGGQQIEKRNLIRTRNQLIAYASENERLWRSFITLTFKDNITDLSEANKAFHNWCRQVRRDHPDHAYLFVPEFQKRGAVHYHGLSSLICGVDIPEREPIRTWNAEKKRTYTQIYYGLPHWSKGFSVAEDLASMDDQFNCALYVTKYLFKDVDDRLFGRQKIMRSQNLRTPTTYYLNSETFHGAITYLIEKGYPLSLYDFHPTEPYQVPHTAYTIGERIAPEDRDIVECIVANAYSESHA